MKTLTASEVLDAIAFEAIALLNDDQCIALRQTLTSMGVKELPRNLYYNYESQAWIEGPDFPVQEVANA